MPDRATSNSQVRSTGNEVSGLDTKLLDQGLYSKEVTLKVKPNDNVRISYSGHYGSGDLSLVGGISSRNAYGIANISRANLQDGSIEYRIQIEKSFKGNLHVGLNGQSTVLNARKEEPATSGELLNGLTLPKVEKSTTASINQSVLPKLTAVPEREVTPQKSEQPKKLLESNSSPVVHNPINFKNLDGQPQNIKPLSRAQAPEFYDLVKTAEQMGLELRISNPSTRDGAHSERTVSIQSANHALDFTKTTELSMAGDYASRVAKMTGFMKSAISEFGEQRQETIERVRHVQGVAGLKVNHAESPAVAALLAEARKGGIDLVAVKETDKGVTLRIWAPDLKRYSPGEVTIPRNVLNGAAPDAAGKQALAALDKDVSLYQKRAAWMMDRKEGVSDQFVEQVLATYESVPKPIMNSIILSGARLQLQDKMSSKADLEDAPPGGRENLVGRLPIAKIWDSVGGAVFWQGSGVIVLNEKTLDTQNLSKGLVSRSPEMIRATALHELGHVMDGVLAKRDGVPMGKAKISENEEFAIAYIRDTNRLSFRPPASRASASGVVAENPSPTATSASAIDYYLLPGNAGRSELFATLFAAVIGKDRNVYADIKNSFPSSYDEIERHIDSVR